MVATEEGKKKGREEMASFTVDVGGPMEELVVFNRAVTEVSTININATINCLGKNSSSENKIQLTFFTWWRLDLP